MVKFYLSNSSKYLWLQHIFIDFQIPYYAAPADSVERKGVATMSLDLDTHTYASACSAHVRRQCRHWLNADSANRERLRWQQD